MEIYEPKPEMYELNRQKVCKKMREALGDKLKDNQWGIFKGEIFKTTSNSDNNHLFIQEPYFAYLFGCHEITDCWGAIHYATGKSILFIPEYPENFWSEPLDEKELQERYGPFDVHYHSQTTSYNFHVKTTSKKMTMESFLEKNDVEGMKGVNQDSGLDFETPSLPNIAIKGSEILFNMASDARATKNKHELDLMRWGNKVSSMGHVALLRSAKPDIKEFVMANAFYSECAKKGNPQRFAYGPIAASGPSGAVLHYQTNNRMTKDGHIALCDFGCSYYDYTTDITTSFPINGKFSDNQKVIYNIVLDAQKAVMNAIKPGVKWSDMHILAGKVILKGLQAANIVLEGDVDELYEAGVADFFFPHGLGHLLGITTHDAGGYLKGITPDRPDTIKVNLRTSRVLEENMVITIEPGCYFNKMLINWVKTKKDEKHVRIGTFLNMDKIEKEFIEFGGVRIEDNVVITKDGFENFTKVPRDVDDIERVMAGGDWSFE